MIFSAQTLPRRSRLAALRDHIAVVEGPRELRRILHPLPAVLLLVVCAMIAGPPAFLADTFAGWVREVWPALPAPAAFWASCARPAPL